MLGEMYRLGEWCPDNEEDGVELRLFNGERISMVKTHEGGFLWSIYSRAKHDSQRLQSMSWEATLELAKRQVDSEAMRFGWTLTEPPPVLSEEEVVARHDALMTARMAERRASDHCAAAPEDVDVVNALRERAARLRQRALNGR